MAMAQQAYQASSRGTLVPGQTISVNKYTVQVERYLSQGGFAHVYCVRTAQPVYNTTHHVLKRIAVANETMLTEVKKEVDIMRILRGHPNIVYLIDAAWHRMPNGMYEVFILMEFCQGGGIIDMMNRRLRVRLTEAEILQIFVDVCEGVASMHNLRPPLLHRDLKVENILQSSPNTYKLCDFGSAATVAPRAPATTQEIRELEADLNRHTTLQYRAPEMVDPYLRRPVDEKSDVWALGVLLYKLCYYTTPFEEHGPLAILNVQYKIPPYPIYSSNMNALIGMMLREHGVQRPTIFEILDQVHSLRGTKSRFTYNVPVAQPLSPRLTQIASSIPPTNPLDDLISYRSPPTAAALPGLNRSGTVSVGGGIQARERVLQAIAPMRRGRPTVSAASSSRTPSPQKAEDAAKDKGLRMNFSSEEDEAWRAMKSGQSNITAGGVRVHKSGLAKTEAWKTRTPVIDLSTDDPWVLSGKGEGTHNKKAAKDKSAADGFGDSFPTSLGLLSSSEAASAAASSAMKPRSSPISIPPRPPSATPALGGESTRSSRLGVPLRSKTKDAFDGLGLSPSEKAEIPTLGEASKSVTGLAVPNGSLTNMSTARSSRSVSPMQPSPSSRSAQTQGLPSFSALPTSSAAWKHTTIRSEDLAPEQRFPSLEELDRTFASPSASVSPGHDRRPTSQFFSAAEPSRRQVPSSAPAVPPRSDTAAGVRPEGQWNDANTSETKAMGVSTYGHDGTKSQQVTGTAMRESAQRRFGEPIGTNGPRGGNVESTRLNIPRRPTLSRKHRSSVSIKHTPPTNTDLIDISPTSASNQPSTFSSLVRSEARDWLTGTDDEGGATIASSTGVTSGIPVLRRSPSKHASVIQLPEVGRHSPHVAVAALHVSPPPSPSPPEKKPVHSDAIGHQAVRRPSPIRTATVPKETPLVGQLTDNWSPVAAKTPGKDTSSSSGSDDGPEDVDGSVAREVNKRGEERGSIRRKTRKGRQSSVHDLVDLWGGGGSPGKEEKRTSRISPSSPTKLRSDSPQASYSPLVEAAHNGHSPKRRQSTVHRKEPSGVHLASPSPAPSPMSNRSRPQSMFIFPVSKTTSEGGAANESPAPSPGLKPPENPKRPSSRRTSISDMVQMYESIGGKAKGQGPAPPPSAPSKPASLRVATHTTSSGSAGHPSSRLTKVSPTRTSGNRKGNMTGQGLPSAPDDSSRGFGPQKDRITPSGLPRGSAIDITQRSSTHDTGAVGADPQRSVPIKPSLTSNESSGAEAPRISSFPLRKQTVAVDEPPPSSPDKPYQGVGKLIDQWQRKTAEAERSESPAPGARRGGLAPRRAGMVGGAAGSGR